MADDLYESLGMDASAECMARLKTIIIVVVVLVVVLALVGVGIFCFLKKRKAAQNS